MPRTWKKHIFAIIDTSFSAKVEWRSIFVARIGT